MQRNEKEIKEKVKKMEKKEVGEWKKNTERGKENTRNYVKEKRGKRRKE